MEITNNIETATNEACEAVIAIKEVCARDAAAGIYNKSRFEEVYNLLYAEYILVFEHGIDCNDDELPSILVEQAQCIMFDCWCERETNYYCGCNERHQHAVNA